MTGATWATLVCAVIFLAVLVVVVADSRTVRQRLRNQDGQLIGVQLDLDAANTRIAELQSYLSDYDSWATDTAAPVPARIADRRVRDRWAAPSGAARPPTTETSKKS